MHKKLSIIILVLILAICLIPKAYAQKHFAETATISGDTGTYTSHIGVASRGYIQPVNVSIYGASAWVATINLERRFSETGTWMVVKQYTATDAVSNSIQERIDDAEPGCQYRLGCASGNYTSGTILLRLSK